MNRTAPKDPPDFQSTEMKLDIWESIEIRNYQQTGEIVVWWENLVKLSQKENQQVCDKYWRMFSSFPGKILYKHNSGDIEVIIGTNYNKDERIDFQSNRFCTDQIAK